MPGRRQLFDFAKQVGAVLAREAQLTQRRTFANVPQEYQQFYRSPAAQRSSNVKAPRDAEVPTTAAAAANTPAPGAPLRVWMFPWERRQLEGGALRTWEKAYWGIFVTAIALFLFSRLHTSPAAAEEDLQAKEDKEGKKRQAARAVLAGKSFTEAGDVFEGLTPQEIQDYVVKATDGATSQDPFEGLSPEEINEYLAQHKA